MISYLMYPARMRRLFIASILLTYGLSRSINAAAEDRLRSLPNDGANAAALLGGILGVEIPPGLPEGGESTNSLESLQQRLQAYGVATSVRSLSYDELASCNLPCVVPMRFTDTEKTSFCVFIQANDSEVYFVEAGPLMTRAMFIDDFRRQWVGYALFGSVAQTNYGALLKCALLGSGLPVASFGLYTCLNRHSCRRRRLPA